ncbi:copper-binding protein [Acidovorax sp.]|uniref:copper-binding protein n=1 Tax=Acidovorax sp. TaxID=1872122 RepID=UPI002ACEE7F4|nr:copper-binding protein [Acidovorax sp.]MDZ7864233.1 copper-binding protein [Acidovorax sp.]
MTHHTTHPLRIALLATTLLFSAATAFAGDDHDHGEDHGSHAAPAAAQATKAPAAATADLSEGEVVRWDAASAKVTLRHGPIRNLDMPPMTMVFRVTDPAQAAQVKPGAKVRFRAEQQAGAYVVTRIEPVAN